MKYDPLEIQKQVYRDQFGITDDPPKKSYRDWVFVGFFGWSCFWLGLKWPFIWYEFKWWLVSVLIP